MVAPWGHYARYNRLANETLYEACAALRDEERRRDLGAFFGSVHGTLNHLLLGDRIWMTRFEGGDSAAAQQAFTSKSHPAFPPLRHLPTSFRPIRARPNALSSSMRLLLVTKLPKFPTFKPAASDAKAPIHG